MITEKVKFKNVGSNQNTVRLRAYKYVSDDGDIFKDLTVEMSRF